MQIKIPVQKQRFRIQLKWHKIDPIQQSCSLLHQLPDRMLPVPLVVSKNQKLQTVIRQLPASTNHRLIRRQIRQRVQAHQTRQLPRHVVTRNRLVRVNPRVNQASRSTRNPAGTRSASGWELTIACLTMRAIAASWREQFEDNPSTRQSPATPLPPAPSPPARPPARISPNQKHHRADAASIRKQSPASRIRLDHRQPLPLIPTVSQYAHEPSVGSNDRSNSTGAMNET